MKTVASLALCTAVLASVNGCSKKPDPKIGEPVKFDDSTWVVVSASAMGQALQANNDFTDAKKTSGQLVEVHYKVTNNENKEDAILDGPKLVDSTGREFSSMPQEAMYVPKSTKTIILESLQPGMTGDFYTIYDVPAEASGFKFKARSLGAFPSTKLVDLGQLSAPPPESTAVAAAAPSTTATASASAAVAAATTTAVAKSAPAAVAPTHPAPGRPAPPAPPAPPRRK
jgi:hypothetical protein